MSGGGDGLRVIGGTGSDEERVLRGIAMGPRARQDGASAHGRWPRSLEDEDEAMTEVGAESRESEILTDMTRRGTHQADGGRVQGRASGVVRAARAPESDRGELWVGRLDR